MLDHILSPIAPHSCCGCGLVGEILCQLCKNDISSDPFSRCLVCLKPTLSSNLCDACRNSSPFTAAWCVGIRQGPLKALLSDYKFIAARHASYVCADLLLEQLPQLPSETVAVPVPTAAAHRRTRGFDHMGRIVSRIASSRNMPYGDVLRRSDNETQHFKNRSERLRISTKSFQVVGVVPEVILLVDDIYTTGSTLSSCTRVLRTHGAKQVFAAVIARQVLDEGDDL